MSTSVSTATISVAPWRSSTQFEHLPVAGDHALEEIAAPAVEAALLVPAACGAAASRTSSASASATRPREMRIDTASVIANSRNSRPTTSPMNSSGISTAISENVSEMIVNAICCVPLSAASSGGFALLDVARDVLDDDDRVVDDEAGGDGQRHQRQVVDREARPDTSRRTCRPATAAPQRSG